MIIELGDMCEDKVSGFKGVAVSEHLYLNGCTRITLQPVVDKEGKLPDTQTFDEPQLRVSQKGYAIQGSKEVGGPEKYSDNRRDV